MRIEHFKLLNLINKGAYGEVYRCIHTPTNKQYALKLINKSIFFKTTSALTLFREKEILRHLKESKYVVNLRASFQDKTNIYIVMELVDGLNLAEFLQQSLDFMNGSSVGDNSSTEGRDSFSDFHYDCLEEDNSNSLEGSLDKARRAPRPNRPPLDTQNRKGLPEREVQKIIKQIVNGLADLKKIGISHGDLKPENIMIRAQNHLECNEKLKISVTLDQGEDNPSGKKPLSELGENTTPERSPSIVVKKTSGNSPSQSTKELMKFKHEFLDRINQDCSRKSESDTESESESENIPELLPELKKVSSSRVITSPHLSPDKKDPKFLTPSPPKRNGMRKSSSDKKKDKFFCNFTVDDQGYEIKLVDFGCAQVYEENSLNKELVEKIKNFEQHLNKSNKKTEEFVGTTNFVSPEYIESTRAHINNDLWALGVLTVYLLTGEYPFEDKSEYLTFQRILNVKYELPSVSYLFLT